MVSVFRRCLVTVSIIGPKTRKLLRELAWWKRGDYTVQSGKLLEMGETTLKQTPNTKTTRKHGEERGREASRSSKQALNKTASQPETTYPINL